jgi:hypothetical protein
LKKLIFCKKNALLIYFHDYLKAPGQPPALQREHPALQNINTFFLFLVQFGSGLKLNTGTRTLVFLLVFPEFGNEEKGRKSFRSRIQFLKKAHLNPKEILKNIWLFKTYCF